MKIKQRNEKTGRPRNSKEDYPSRPAAGPLYVVTLPGEKGRNRYSITHGPTGYALAFFAKQSVAMRVAIRWDQLITDREGWESKTASRVKESVPLHVLKWAAMQAATELTC